MSVYDPFDQGYMHDWRLEEAVRLGVRRALEEVMRRLLEHQMVYLERAIREGIALRERWHTEEEIQRIVEERIGKVKEDIVKALEEKIILLVKENQELREKLRKYEEEKGGEG